MSRHISAVQMGLLHTANWSFSIGLWATPRKHLLPSTCQCRGRVLVISLIQQNLKPAGHLTTLQPRSTLSNFCNSSHRTTYNSFWFSVYSYNIAEPSIKSAYHFPFSGSWLCMVGSPQHISSFPSPMMMIVQNFALRQIPDLWFCLQGVLFELSRWSAQTTLHASETWCVKRTFLLNIQTRTGYQGAWRSCASMTLTSEAARVPS